MAQPNEPTKWAQRDRKVTKRSKGMRITGRSVFVIRTARAKRDERILTVQKHLL